MRWQNSGTSSIIGETYSQLEHFVVVAVTNREL